MSGSRARPLLAVLLAGTIALGLGSRSGGGLVPDFFARHAGDALWTVAVYWSLALLRPVARPRTLLCCALALSLAVELSQLLTFDWLERLRATTLGRLTLGQGWQWADLPRYAAGALLACGLDRALVWRAGTRSA